MIVIRQAKKIFSLVLVFNFIQRVAQKKELYFFYKEKNELYVMYERFNCWVFI